MGVIVDTSVLIGAERQKFDMDGLLANLGDEAVAIAAITASELLHGVERSRDPVIRANRSSFAEAVFESFAVIPFGLAEARIHAGIWATLAAKGRMIGAHDLQVAATAVSTGSSLVTLNQKHFKRVPGLAVLTSARFAKD